MSTATVNQPSANPGATAPNPLTDIKLSAADQLEIDRLTHEYFNQYRCQAATAGHIYYLMACAVVRQAKLEVAQIVLLDRITIDDPIHARVERLRAAAERSFYRGIKELQALLQNEPKSKSAPPSPVDETKPTRPTMEELRKLHPGKDRNELARMRANMPIGA